MILEFGGQGGDKHFGISEGKGGLIFSGFTQLFHLIILYQLFIKMHSHKG